MYTCHMYVQVIYVYVHLWSYARGQAANQLSTLESNMWVCPMFQKHSLWLGKTFPIGQQLEAVRASVLDFIWSTADGFSALLKSGRCDKKNVKDHERPKCTWKNCISLPFSNHMFFNFWGGSVWKGGYQDSWKACEETSLAIAKEGCSGLLLLGTRLTGNRGARSLRGHGACRDNVSSAPPGGLFFKTFEREREQSETISRPEMRIKWIKN